MVELITLVSRAWVGAEHRETRRDVLAEVLSVGYKEFYAASATDYHPEVKFKLTDYLDYQGETLAVYNGKMYRVLRTYRIDQALELTAEYAPNEELEPEPSEELAALMDAAGYILADADGAILTEREAVNDE
jgi:hypothetical protein